MDIPFLDVLFNKRSRGTVGRTVYRKPNSYGPLLTCDLRSSSGTKRAALSALINRARTICDSRSSEEETEHLKRIFEKTAGTQ
jgi:hypothetical protein